MITTCSDARSRSRSVILNFSAAPTVVVPLLFSMWLSVDVVTALSHLSLCNLDCIFDCGFYLLSCEVMFPPRCVVCFVCCYVSEEELQHFSNPHGLAAHSPGSPSSGLRWGGGAGGRVVSCLVVKSKSRADLFCKTLHGYAGLWPTVCSILVVHTVFIQLYFILVLWKRISAAPAFSISWKH